MPLPISAQIGPISPSPSGTPLLRTGPTAELVMSEMYGKYYEATRLGLVFTSIQAIAGLALLTSTSTTINYALFNPPASGKKAILIKQTFGYISGTMTAGAIMYAVNTALTNAVTGTALTITNNLNGGPSSSLQAFSTATVVAMTNLRPAKYSQVVQAATATNAPFQFDEDLDGSIVLPPGGALGIGGNIALGTVVVCSTTWIEIPFVAGA